MNLIQCSVAEILVVNRVNLPVMHPFPLNEIIGFLKASLKNCRVVKSAFEIKKPRCGHLYIKQMGDTNF